MEGYFKNGYFEFIFENLVRNLFLASYTVKNRISFGIWSISQILCYQMLLTSFGQAAFLTASMLS